MLQQIGKYRIIDELGRGGLSRLYRALHPNLGRHVALQISTTGTDPAHLALFQQDVSAAAALAHPNIVTVHDLEYENGAPYLVMELLDGGDLEELITLRTHLSHFEKLRAMVLVGEGLQYAHERGVVHQDLAPANVMLLKDGTVKILGFGVARLVYDPARVTATGYLVGSPLYMSPERFEGHPPDILCDIWSYGVTFYELMTLVHPFYAEEAAGVITNIVEADPPKLPDPLGPVIARALEKNRRLRYQSAAALLFDLKPLLAIAQSEEVEALFASALRDLDAGQVPDAQTHVRRALQIDPAHRAARELLIYLQQPARARGPLPINALVPVKSVPEIHAKERGQEEDAAREAPPAKRLTEERAVVLAASSSRSLTVTRGPMLMRNSGIAFRDMSIPEATSLLARPSPFKVISILVLVVLLGLGLFWLLMVNPS